MSIEIKIREDLPLGTWLGLGGAITEAVAYNFAKLSPEKQQKCIDVYYGATGADVSTTADILPTGNQDPLL